jgi:O-antigen/teichoic acid export membrane protein
LSGVRVTYSGLISFFVSIIGVITGTIFVVIVTRQLSPEDFGLWTLIGSLVSYVTIVNPIVTYWTTRHIARGENVGKTALSTNVLFSLGGVVVYSIMAIMLSDTLGADLLILLLAAGLIPTIFLENILNSIAHGYKPQAVSYGLVVFESTKIPLGFIMVVFLELGIFGVIITSIIASVLKIIILVILTREQLVGKIKHDLIKFWLRLSWLTLYMSLFGFIRRLDVLLVSVVSGSLIGIAYWGAATTATNLITHSGHISHGLYPKLLATGKKAFAEENLKRIMYFAVPILGATIIFAKPILNILNPEYVNGESIVIILSFRSILAILLGFSLNIIESYEKIDLDKQANFKQFFKSKLFLVPTLNILHSIVYLGGLGIFLLLISMEMTDVYIVTIWSLIFTITYIPFVIYGLFLINKNYKIKLPINHMGKYIIATIVAGIPIYYIVSRELILSNRIYEFLPQFIPIVILGSILYLGITYLIDKDTRVLGKSIFIEMKKSIKF